MNPSHTEIFCNLCIVYYVEIHQNSSGNVAIFMAGTVYVAVHCKSIGSESKFSSVCVMGSQGLSNEIDSKIYNKIYNISTIATVILCKKFGWDLQWPGIP